MDSEMHRKREQMFSSLLPIERKSEEGYNPQGHASILGRTNDQANATHITDRAGPSPLGTIPGLRSSRIDLSSNSRPLLSQFRLADHMPIRSLPRSVTSMSDLKYTFQNGPNPENTVSSTHSLNRGLSLTSYSQMDRKFDPHAHQQTRTQSLLDLHKPLSPLETRTAMGSRLSLKSFNSQSPDATFPQQFNHSYNKGITSPSGNQADKSPPYNVFSYQSRNANIPAKLGGEDGSRTVIVKSTLCYNTSTQTDMPYTDNMTDASINTPRMRHADEQAFEVSSPGLSKKLELFGRICEEKSVQTTLNSDLINQSLHLKAGSYLFSNNRRHSEVLPHSDGIMPYGMSSQTIDRKETDLSSYNSDRRQSGNYSRQCSYENNTPLEGLRKYQTRYASHEMLNGEVLPRQPSDSTFFNTAPALHNQVSDGYRQKHGLISEVNSATLLSRDPPTSGNLLANSGKRCTESGIDSNNNICSHHKTPSDLYNFSDYGSTFGSSTSRHIPSAFPNSAHLGSLAGSHGYSRYTPEPLSNQSWSTSSMITDPDMKVHNLSLTSGVGSEVSSMYSYPQSPPLESFHDMPFTKSQQSFPHATNHTSSPPASSTFQWKKIVILNPDHIKRSRHDSDSVFIDEDEIEPKYLMYKDFRQKTFPAETSSPNEPTSHTFLSDGLHQLTSATDDPFKPCDRIASDQSVLPSPKSRVHRISESLSLGKIQEEAETLNAAIDKNASITFSRSENLYNANERSVTNGLEKCEKEHEVLMRGSIANTCSDLKERRSETFVDIIASGNLRRGSLDSAAFQRSSYQGVDNSSTLSAFRNYNRSHSTLAYSMASSQNLVVRGESDLQITQQRLQQLQTNREHGVKSTSNDIKEPQSGKQQMQIKYYDEESSFSSSTLHDISSLDNSLASVRNQSLTETVAELIFKVSENLNRSAQRMGHIRRSSSSSSRSSLDIIDTVRPERTSRRETDWSRIRSLSSLRCSPETDRWSYWNSFASDYLTEDAGILTSSTPRASFALSRDKASMLEASSHDASMDSGLVVSPIYQNFPTQRRPPPPPRPTASTDTEPPPLPPRMNREKQPSVSGTQAALDQESPPNYVSTKEKHRIEVIPLGKQQEDDVRVDTSKMNFKDLMMQWKNNSPRENTSPSDLRRQEQKTAEKHSPTSRLVSCVPTTLERTKPTISVASTYRHEPAQKLEATSPVFSQVSSLSSPSKSAFSTSPSVPYVVSAFAESSSLHQPLGVQPSALTKNTAAYRGLQGTSPSSSDVLSPDATDYTGGFSNTTQSSSGVRMTLVNQSPPVNTSQTPPFGRISFLAYSRSRSSSDLLSDQPPGNEHLVTTQPAPVKLHRLLRDRSSSDHDILSDKPSQFHHRQFRPSQDGTALTISKSQSAEGADESTLKSQLPPYGDRVKNTFVASGRLSNSTLALSNGYEIADENHGFAAESYIGHKTISSRNVGTYNRSVSATGLLSAANSTQGKPTSGSDGTPFRNSKLEQQSWNSESLLSSTGNGVKTFLEMGSQVGKAPKDGNQTTVTPVRPPRPNARGRQNAKQASSTASVSNVSQKPAAAASVSNVSQKTKQASVSLSALDSLAPAASFSVEQGNVSQGEGLHRPAPSTPSSPPYDHSQHGHWSPQHALHSLSTVTASGQVSDRRPTNSPQHSNYAPQHRQLALNNNLNSNLSKTSLDNGQPQSVFIQDSTAKPVSPCSPKEQVPVNISARDYQRQTIDTASAMLSFTSFENTPTSPLENSAFSPHRSDINMNSPRESKRKSSSTPILNHLRQPSQEEIECDEKVMELAEELDESDQKLLEVLSQDRAMKRMLYMDGLFSDVANDHEKTSTKQTSSSSMRNRTLDRVGGDSYDPPGSFKSYSLPRDYQQTPPSRAALSSAALYGASDKGPDTSPGMHENPTVMKHKEELVEKLQKKIQVLKDEKLSLQQEIADNILLGQQVCQVADSRCQTQGEKEKFMTFIDDLEKIVRLLLNLSGQLARAENAVQALGPETDSKLKKLTWDKREKLHAKHEEAKMLKEAVDRRSEQLLCMLQERLSAQELSDYKHFISMKSRLTIEMQEVDDHLALAEQQIVAVKRSLPAPGASSPGKYLESS